MASVRDRVHIREIMGVHLNMNSANYAGRLVADPVLKATTSGKNICRFTLACDRIKKDDGADFIPCVAWNQSAEFITQYAQKGDMIGVTGSMRSGKYEKDGVTHYTLDCWADRVQILGSPKKKSDYPNNGTSVKLQDADKLEVSIDPNEDLPF